MFHGQNYRHIKILGNIVHIIQKNIEKGILFRKLYLTLSCCDFRRKQAKYQLVFNPTRHL